MGIYVYILVVIKRKTKSVGFISPPQKASYLYSQSNIIRMSINVHSISKKKKKGVRSLTSMSFF